MNKTAVLLVFVRNELHAVKTPLKQPQPPALSLPTPPPKKREKRGKVKKSMLPPTLRRKKKVNSHNPALYLRNGQTGGSRTSVHDIVQVGHPTAKSAVKRQAAAGRMRQNQVSNMWPGLRSKSRETSRLRGSPPAPVHETNTDQAIDSATPEARRTREWTHHNRFIFKPVFLQVCCFDMNSRGAVQACSSSSVSFSKHQMQNINKILVL